MPRAKSPETNEHSRSNRNNRTGWRRVLFPLTAILLALLPFVLLEGILTVFGAAAKTENVSAGFDGSRLFELDEDGETYATTRAHLLFFGRQEFARVKPERTFRIFGLGGSTVHGRPYENGSSFLKWMEIGLNARDSTHKYETVNCGGLSYASYRLTTMLNEILQYDPDLIVVATGHNEFLEDRTYHSQKSLPACVRWAVRKGSQLRTVKLGRQLLPIGSDEMEHPNDRRGLAPEVEARLDSKSGYASYHRDEEWRRSVIDQYEDSLRRMVDACRGAHVPLILINLGENLRDCPPFKSEHREDLSANSLQRWQELFDRATDIDDADPAGAVNLYGQAEAIDDQYALLAFRMARCFDRMGNIEQARGYYQKARQLDICPLRMVEELHERVKKVARETRKPLIDAEASAAEISPDGIPGNNCFMDHVHPDIGFHQRIGQLLADEAEAMGLVTANRRWTEAQRRKAYRNHLRRLGPAYLANGRRRVGWLENWARHERLDEEAVPKDAWGHLRLGKKHLDYGEVDQAWQEFLPAIADEPQCIEEIFDYAFDLFSQGRTSLAEQVLVRLHQEPAAETYRPAIALADVVAALDEGDTAQAQVVVARYGDAVERAVVDSNLGKWITALPDVTGQLDRLLANRANLPSNDLNADPFLASASVSPVSLDAKSDALAAAADLLDKAIVRNPNSPLLFLGRARMRFSQHDYKPALVDLTRCIELAPDNTEALKFRAILQMIQGNAHSAVDDLTSAIAIDSNDPEMLRMRAAAYRRLGDDAKANADLEAAKHLALKE